MRQELVSGVGKKELKFYIENEIKNNIMWLNLIGMAVKTGADVYKRKQETKSLQALAERNHAEKMARGEIEYQSRIIDNQNQGIKDEIVLAIVILPIIVIAYSVFSGTPDAKAKIRFIF
jgi:hypothetical protein